MKSIRVQNSGDHVSVPVAYAAQREKHHVSLKWANLELAIKGKRILRPQSGIAQAGRLLAIMGPSGSGKTSLLHCLAGRRQGVVGDIALNTERISGPAIRFNVGFVPQEDLLFGFLTVEETIRYSAGLQLRCSAAEREAAVEDVIQRSGLDLVRHTKVGSVVVRGVSGGEKRRVSIATEAVSNKPILFLDEPTSGLDSAATFFVVSFMQRLCRENGTAVISTIHQPSAKVFELFDDLLILSYGNPVYYGPASALANHLAHLGRSPPANSIAVEFVLDFVNADFAGTNKEAMKEEILEFAAQSMALCAAPKDVEVAAASRLRTDGSPVWQQVAMLLHRGFVNASRNWVYYWVRIAMLMALALLAGTVWFNLGNSYDSVQNRLGVIFFSVAFPCFMAVAGIPGFLEERSVIMREIQNGYYNSLAYVVSSSVVMLPFLALGAFLYCAIAYWLEGLHKDARQFFTYCGIFFSSIWCAENAMLVFPALVPNFVVALTFASFFNGFVMMLQGYFVRYADIPKFWVWGHYFSYQKYAFEAMCRNEFDGLIFDCLKDQTTNFTCSCTYIDDLNPQCQFRGETVMKNRSYNDVCVPCWTFVMIGMAIGFRIVFWILMEWRARSSMK
eukprot:EG_transcript_3838